MVGKITTVGMPIPKIDDTPAQPTIDKEPPTPAEYVRIWVEKFGSFESGKIEMARKMHREDLTKADVEYLLANGVTKGQIAKCYGIPPGSIGFYLRKLSVATEPEEVWFTQKSTIGPYNQPITSVSLKNINFSAAFMRLVQNPTEYVHLCAVSDGTIKVKFTQDGLWLRQTNKNKDGAGRSISCGKFAQQVAKWGAALPMRYEMTQESDSVWIGRPIRDSSD